MSRVEKNKVDEINFVAKIEVIKMEIQKKDEIISKLDERIQKEEHLIRLHETNKNKIFQERKRIHLERNSLKMDLIDLHADDAKVDREQFFNQLIANVSTALPKNNEEGRGLENLDVTPENEMTPLQRAKAELIKKHPNVKKEI